MANKGEKNRFSRTPGPASHARILSAEDRARCLDTLQLQKLEGAFRSWAEAAERPDLESSRKRILLIFLLIRHTGARLSEVLHLDPSGDIDYKNHIVRLHKGGAESGRPSREVEISEALSVEIEKTLDDPELKRAFGGVLWVDPGHVRRMHDPTVCYARLDAVAQQPQPGEVGHLRVRGRNLA